VSPAETDRYRAIGQALTALANEVVRRFASKEILFDYYSRERVMSPEAKAAWIERDLRPL
jgi:hypothetical protein